MPKLMWRDNKNWYCQLCITMTSAEPLEGHNEILKCMWRWPHSWFEVTADVDFPSNNYRKIFI